MRGLSSAYDIEHLARVFFPRAHIAAPGAPARGDVVFVRAGGARLAVGVRIGKVCRVQVVRAGACPAADEKEKTRCLSRMFYDIMVQLTGERPPWGILTGVRPVNYLRRVATARGGGARAFFLDDCRVLPQKYEMAKTVLAAQAPALAASAPDSYSLYVSVPFCPSRCSYCSFVSQTIAREGHLAAQYVDCARRELEATARLAERLHLRLETVYVGGGTPTALCAEDLRRLLGSIGDCFDVAAAREFTVEAGRPDCTDAEKLAVIKEAGAARISVNPQSLSNVVLSAIGRRHTAEDFFHCYADAQAEGFDQINVDLIAGLPQDTPATFADTLKQVLALAPANVTLHTLTVKRGASLRTGQGGFPVYPLAGQAAEDAARMLEEAYPALAENGYVPYYLYRQKGTPANMENTGWTKPGAEGLYNIYTMEEAHSIFAVGAGAATKVVLGAQNLIKRECNPKFPADYCAGIGDVLRQKEGVERYYAGNVDSETAG